MKRVVLLICAVFVLYGQSSAQDVVTLRTGNVFNAKIVSIEGDQIKYKDFNDANGTERTIFSRDVYSIQFENGVTQVFDQTSTASKSTDRVEAKKSVSTKISTDKDDPYSQFFGEYNIAAHFGDVFALRLSGDLGKSFEEVPVFVTLGVGMTAAFMGDYTSRSLRIPAEVGYFIGDSRKVHMDIRGGIGWNYLTGMDYDGHSVDLSGYSRSSWNGSVRVSFGYHKVSLFGQYDFSFQSGGGGSWYIGLCLM